MKKLTAAALALLLLAGCRAPAGESPAPTESVPAAESPVPTAVLTPAPAVEAASTPAAPTPASAAEPAPTQPPTPTPDLGDLTQEEVDRVNRAFSYLDCDWEGDSDGFLEVNGFFLSHYTDVRELNFEEFLHNFPADWTLSQGEVDALRILVNYSGYGVAARRLRRDSVDAVLNRYAGITTRELADTSGPCYLPEYDSWYNFTSDFGPNRFHCVGGRVTEDTAVLWTGEDDYCAGVRDELTLKKEGENWHIQSFLRVPVDREVSLDAYLLGLADEEVTEVSWSGMVDRPLPAVAAELVRKAAQNPAYGWEYGGTFWDMTLCLADGERLSIMAGEKQDIVCISGEKRSGCFRAPALYGLLRTQNDTEEREIDREALKKYQRAVDAYLAENTPKNSNDVPVHLELTGFYQVGENPALDLQVWCVATVCVADPPERIMEAIGNGYVDSKLRFHAVGSDWYNLLVTAEGEALGFWDWNWLETGGLTRYATVEELKEAMNGR